MLLGGCKRCSPAAASKPQAYAEAQTCRRCAFPVGLDGPDTRAALKIPDAERARGAPRGPKDPCLEEPPPSQRLRLRQRR